MTHNYILTTYGKQMTDTQILESILEAYKNWQEEIGLVPETSDCLHMTDEQYDAMMESFDKEIARLENEFFSLVSKAASGELRN